MKIVSISIVLPMYNESDSIKDAVTKISAFARGLSENYEIVIVDDASTDASVQVVEGVSAVDSHVKLIKMGKNTKFGGALKAGLLAASGDIILYTDSDLPAKEEDMKKALEMLDSADIVSAYSLVIKDASIKRIVMSKVYNILVHTLFNLKIRDANSGLKIYKKRVFEGMKLISESPFIDVEIFSEAHKKGFTIKQYGLIFDLRTTGKSSIARLSVVARTFWDMLVYRFTQYGG